MKTVTRKMLLSLAALILLGSVGLAQDGTADGDSGPNRPRANVRRDLFRQLGLNPAQVRQIGQMNTRRRPLLEAAQQRLREANRLLDEAIYADQLNEADVHDRLKEVQLSQAELIRLRSMSELSIRKILTPDQLVLFRRMRQRFDAMNGAFGRQAGLGLEPPNKDLYRNK